MQATALEAHTGKQAPARRRSFSTWWALAGVLWLVCGQQLPRFIGRALAKDAAVPASTQRYTLRAVLDSSAHTVRGHVSISLVHTAGRPLDALVFHLYMNAFRDRRSVFMREAAGLLRGDEYTGPGSIELVTLQVNGRDVLGRAERELVRSDFTQLRVALDKPLAVGERIQVESDFVTKLPPVFARSGYAGQFFAVAQWFPKLAKLEQDGTFASFPYHGLGEFYADFADYTLVVDAPQNYVLAATGELSHEHSERGRTVRRYEARHVHDVAWVASPHLRAHVERLGPVEVRLLMPPGYEGTLDEHMGVIRAGLKHFERQFGPYPYPTLSVVLPPREAAGAAGMEYPTLIVTAGEWLSSPGSPRLSGAFVTAHELAHQWFHGLLASNEVRYPVLDEGFAEWASLDLMRSMRAGNSDLSTFVPIDMFEAERQAASVSRAPPGLAAYAFSAREYGASVYGRGAIVLESIRRSLGRARFEKAMRLYTAQQRFEHPRPDDLARSFDAVYGAGFSARTLLPLLLEGESSAVHVVEAHTHADKGLHRTSVRARRTGRVSLPTWVAAYDARGGELARTAWPEHARWLDISFETRLPVARVSADPDRALLVDDDSRDQTVVFADAAAFSTLFTRLSAALTLLLSWVGP